MQNDHISIIGLTETKLKQNYSMFNFKQFSDNFSFYFNNDFTLPNGLGVGLIISKAYSKYVQKHYGYKGHVIYVDLFMKGHIKLRIIQAYLHANLNSNRNDVEDVHKY